MDGGFLVKFDGKDAFRCYAVAFDYDACEYVINNGERHQLPEGVMTITIKMELEEPR